MPKYATFKLEHYKQKYKRCPLVYDDEQTEHICELFEKYAALLNQEFYDHNATEKVSLECIAIANKLLKLGFVIVANVTQSTEMITSSHDTMRIVFTFAYEFVLVPNQLPVQQPIAFASAISKVFGPLTDQTNRERAHVATSIQDDAWLHSVLDDLGKNESSKNP